MFKNWISLGYLGCKVTDNENEFMNTRENMVFNSSDIAMEDFS